MVGHACKMLKGFVTKGKMFSTLPHRQRISYIILEDMDKDDAFDQEDKSPVRSEEPEPSVTAISRKVQEIIYKELNEITDPLFG